MQLPFIVWMLMKLPVVYSICFTIVIVASLFCDSRLHSKIQRLYFHMHSSFSYGNANQNLTTQPPPTMQHKYR